MIPGSVDSLLRLMTMSVADFAVVVLTYGEEPGHRDLVSELRHQGVLPEKITVVRNPISSGAANRSVIDGVEVLRNATNLGYPTAINVGLRQTRARNAPAVLVVTDDLHIESGALEAS